jgi:polar amino acid transport system substrate-binding protein
VITVEGSAAADATSIADLQGLLIGAATGTTSLAAVEQIIQPTAGAQVFNSNDDAKLALESGQVDAIVVDVPTAFYITGVELDGGVIVGSLPDVDGQTDEWGVLLAKDSPLTAKVTAAVDALREDGTLDALVAKWLGADAGVPVLQ